MSKFGSKTTDAIQKSAPKYYTTVDKVCILITLMLAVCFWSLIALLFAEIVNLY